MNIYDKVKVNILSGKVSYRQIRNYFFKKEGYAYKELFKINVIKQMYPEVHKSFLIRNLQYHHAWHKLFKVKNNFRYAQFINLLLNTKDTKIRNKRKSYLEHFA